MNKRTARGASKLRGLGSVSLVMMCSLVVACAVEVGADGDEVAEVAQLGPTRAFEVFTVASRPRGTACTGSTYTFPSADGRRLTTLFDWFEVELNGSQTSMAASCGVTVMLSSAESLSYRVRRMALHGELDATAGVQTRVVASTSLGGVSVGALAERTILGPYADKFVLELLASDVERWSPCAKAARIEVSSNVRMTNRGGGASLGWLDLCNVAVGGNESRMVLDIEWRRCDAEAAPAAPPTD